MAIAQAPATKRSRAKVNGSKSTAVKANGTGRRPGRPKKVAASTTPVAVVEVTPTLADLILNAGKSKKGKTFTAPRLGIDAVVVQSYRNDGAVLLVQDGGRITAFESKCEHELPEGYKGPAFELVGGKMAGTTGYIHRVRGCNRPYAIS